MASEASGTPTRLEVVGDAAPGVPEAGAPRPASGEPRTSRRSFRLLVALLLLAALVLVVQTRRVGQLEGRVESLDTDLAAARQEIEAHQGRIGRVRGLVDDLGTRLEELRGLLGQDPVAAEAPEEAL